MRVAWVGVRVHSRLSANSSQAGTHLPRSWNLFGLPGLRFSTHMAGYQAWWQEHVGCRRQWLQQHGTDKSDWCVRGGEATQGLSRVHLRLRVICSPGLLLTHALRLDGVAHVRLSD